MRIAVGTERTIISLAPTMVRMRNSTPEQSTMSNAFAYEYPRTGPQIVNTKNAFNPIPGACANGIFARNAMSSVPMIAPIAVKM